MKRRIATAILGMAVLLPLSAIESSRRAPELVIQRPGGPQDLLSRYRGKVVLVEFLFTTCPHCQHAAQTISKLNTELGPKGFQPIGIAWDEGAADRVSTFVEMNHVNYPIGVSDRDTVSSFLQISADTRMSVPQFAFIDRKGTIVEQTPPAGDARWADEAQLRAQLEKMLAAAPAAAKPKPAAHHKAT